MMVPQTISFCYDTDDDDDESPFSEKSLDELLDEALKNQDEETDLDPYGSPIPDDDEEEKPKAKKAVPKKKK